MQKTLESKVLGHQWLSRWLKVRRSRIQVQVKMGISGKYQELPEMQQQCYLHCLCTIVKVTTKLTIINIYLFLTAVFQANLKTDGSIFDFFLQLCLSFQSPRGQAAVGAKLQATNRVPRPVDRGTATRYGG